MTPSFYVVGDDPELRAKLRQLSEVLIPAVETVNLIRIFGDLDKAIRLGVGPINGFGHGCWKWRKRNYCCTYWWPGFKMVVAMKPDSVSFVLSRGGPNDKAKEMVALNTILETENATEQEHSERGKEHPTE